MDRRCLRDVSSADAKYLDFNIDFHISYSSPHSGKGQRVIFASISSGRGDVHVHLFPAPAFSFRNLSMRFKRSWMAPLGEHPLKSEISQDLIRFDIFLVETK